MNDLRVKVWDKDNNQWLPLIGDTFAAIDDNGIKVITGGLEYSEEHENVEILVYTGYRDNHNSEICEGDMISHYLDKNAVGLIAFGQYGKNVGFYVKWIRGTHKELLHRELAFWAPISTVVGNKFENIELLGEVI